MTWQINHIENHQQTGECCLKLSHGKKQTQLRNWFGPLAHHLFQQTQLHHLFKQPLILNHHSKCFRIDKQMAQYLLIQASFFHQRCLHQYQINDDIKRQKLTYSHELCELLLFIRMSTQHPSHQTIQLFIDNQLPWCTDFNAEIETLLSAKLIQKISYNDLVFYDKNPYPHDHLLDLKTLKLNDFTHLENKLEQQQLLISQAP